MLFRSSAPRSFGERYGVIVHSPESAAAPHAADELGVLWFLNEGHAAAPPTGRARKLPIIMEIRPGTYLSRRQLQDLLEAHPGVDLVLGNEPNVSAQGNSDGAEYADAFYYYNQLLKGTDGLDPSRRLIAGNTLNWEFTCLRKDSSTLEQHGCVWDYSGHEFVSDFRAAYKLKYGAEPPVDIWGVHAYPLDWTRFPTTDRQILVDQIEGFRKYLDASPQYKNSPIWITEFGIHWGFSCGEPCIVLREGRLVPGEGAVYQSAKVEAFLSEMLDWLEAHADAYRIERWFLYATYVALGAPDPQSNQGISLFRGPQPESGLTENGLTYRARAATR